MKIMRAWESIPTKINKKTNKNILKYNWGFSSQLKKFTFEVSYFRL